MAVLAHGDGLGRHEHPFAVLPHRLDFSGFYGLLAGELGLLLPAHHFPGLGLTLKFCRLFVELPLYGLAAPTLRWIPAGGEVAFAPPSADTNFVKFIPSLRRLLSNTWQFPFPPIFLRLSGDLHIDSTIL